MNRIQINKDFQELQIDSNKNLAMISNLMVNTNGNMQNGAKVGVSNNIMNGSNDINLLGSPGLKKSNNGVKNNTSYQGPNQLFDLF